MRYFLLSISFIFINHSAFTQNHPIFNVPAEYSIDSLAKLLKIKYYKNARGEEYWFNKKGQRTKKKRIIQATKTINNRTTHPEIFQIINYQYNQKNQLIQALGLDNKNDTIYFKHNSYQNDKLKETLIIDLTKTYINPKSEIPFYQDLEYTKTTFQKNGNPNIERRYLSRIISDAYIDFVMIGDYKNKKGIHWKTPNGVKLIPKLTAEKKWNQDSQLVYEKNCYLNIGYAGVYDDCVGFITVYNSCGKKVQESFGDNLEYAKKYNKNCQLISFKRYSLNNEILEDVEYFYDNKNRLIKFIDKSYYKKEIVRIHKNQYDKNKNLIKSYYYYQTTPDSILSLKCNIFNKENLLMAINSHFKGYSFSIIDYLDSNSIHRKYLIPKKMFSTMYLSKKENLYTIDTTQLLLLSIDIYNSDSTFYQQFSYQEFNEVDIIIRYDNNGREIFNNTKKYYSERKTFSEVESTYEYAKNTGKKLLVKQINTYPSNKSETIKTFNDFGKLIYSKYSKIVYKNEKMNESKIITQTYLNDTLPLIKTRIRNNKKYVEEYTYNPNYQLIKYESYKLVNGQKLNTEVIIERKFDKKGMMIYYIDGSIKQNNLPPRTWIYQYYD